MSSEEPKGVLPGDAIFAENVKKIRERRGWSRNELAQRLRDEGLPHFHPTTVSRVESGSRAVRVGELAAFEAALESKFTVLTAPLGEAQKGVDFQEAARVLQAQLVEWHGLREQLAEQVEKTIDARDKMVPLRDVLLKQPDLQDSTWGRSLQYMLDIAGQYVEFDFWAATAAYFERLGGTDDGVDQEA